MTDIHPKQLEAVARVIDPEAFEPMHPTFIGTLNKGTSESAALHFWDVLKEPQQQKAFAKAEKAIRAAFKPLFIEDAPKDACFLAYRPNFKSWEFVRLWYGCKVNHGISGLTFSTDKFIPIPTQESE